MTSPRKSALRLATLACALISALTHAQAGASAKDAKPAGEVDSPTAKGDRLRQPGFLFLELDCNDLEGAIAFFRDVAGFEINRNDGDFVILRSKRGELLLNRRPAPKATTENGHVKGPRIEIGILVDDLDKAFAAAKKHGGWKIASPIARQTWGVRDFRVFSPERYYFRITEGPR